MHITIDIVRRRGKTGEPMFLGVDRATTASMRGTLLDNKIHPEQPRSTLSSRFPGVAKYVRRRYGITVPLYLQPTVIMANTPNPPPSNVWVFVGYGSTVEVHDLPTRTVTRSTPRLRQLQRAAAGK